MPFVHRLAPWLLAASVACSQSEAVIGLSVAAAGSTNPRVGDVVSLVVRAIYEDGSSIDVTEKASCELTGASPPGSLVGTVFTATLAGPTEIVCRFAGETGTLALTVGGVRPTSIVALQRGEVTPDTEVEIEAVVYALDPEDDADLNRYLNFYAQDAGGGPHSGVYFRDLRAAGATTPAEGDRVRVTGRSAERRGRTVVNFTAVEVIGAATPTADTLAIEELDDAVWDGCLIAIEDVIVTDPAFDDYTWEVAAAAPTAGARVLIDTLYYDPAPSIDARFARIVGPLWVYEAADGVGTQHSIAPRRAGDVQP